VTDATIFLVRHGAHDLVDKRLCGRMPGVGLGETGREQARALGRRLAQSRLSAVYSSPMQRARETAAFVGEACGLPVTLDDAIDEIDFGAWSGRAFSELDGQPDWRRWNEDRGRKRPPGGESMAEVQARVARWLEGVMGRHPGQAVAAVSHADVIKAAVAHALGLPIHFHDRFEISPGSATTLVATGAGLKVWAVNEVRHG
jgi:probable phosphoglycerate mutase